MEIWDKYKELLESNNINTILRKSHFFGQAWVESKFIPRRENLNYSVNALLDTFSRKRISEKEARLYGRTDRQKANQKAIANCIYGGEWGKLNLGNTQLNDGWNLRGGGIFQITGRTNFEKLSKDTEIDFINNPDLILEEEKSIISAIWFWNKNNINLYADKDDSLSVSRVINLGNINTKKIPLHYEDRKNKTNELKEKIK